MRGHTLRSLASVPLAFIAACHPASGRPPPQAGVQPTAQPAVIHASDGERRLLPGGTPLLIKVDPVTTGSERLVLGMLHLPPGEAIGVHRHMREDEIIIFTRGTARVQLGTQIHMVGAGAALFIPQGTCIGVTNVGTDTLSNYVVFSSPGFERSLRAVSSPAGEPPKVITPAERAAAFHEGHAVANPPECRIVLLRFPKDAVSVQRFGFDSG